MTLREAAQRVVDHVESSGINGWLDTVPTRDINALRAALDGRIRPRPLIEFDLEMFGFIRNWWGPRPLLFDENGHVCTPGPRAPELFTLTQLRFPA